MNDLVEHVGVLSMLIATKQLENESPEDIEKRLWELVEHGMRIQQQICGGHK